MDARVMGGVSIAMASTGCCCCCGRFSRLSGGTLGDVMASARPWIPRSSLSELGSSSLESEPESESLLSSEEDTSPTPLKSAQTQPRGCSSRISPHSTRSLLPLPARKMILVGVYDSSASKSRYRRKPTMRTSLKKWILR